MAQVTVRIKINKTFECFCNGTNADEVLDDIAENGRLDNEILNYAYDIMTVEGAEYDEVEPDESDDEVEEPKK